MRSVTDTRDRIDNEPRHDGYAHIPMLADAHVCEKPPDWQAEFWRQLYTLKTPTTRDVTDSQKSSPTEEYTPRGTHSDYWELAERRQRCRSPKGLKLDDGDRREYVIARCQLCESCKAWSRELDAVRITEAIEHPRTFTVSETEYERHRQRIKNAGGSYFSAPLEHERRAIVCDRQYAAPDAETVEDLPALLARFDAQRDRTEGRAGRRVATSRMESRKALEAKVLNGDKTEKTAEPERTRKVVGGFNPRAFMATRRPISQAPAWLEDLAAALGLPVERTDLGIAIPTDVAHILDAELKVSPARTSWRVEEPPPEVYEERALWLDEPEVPPEWFEFREKVRAAA